MPGIILNQDVKRTMRYTQNDEGKLIREYTLVRRLKCDANLTEFQLATIAPYQPGLPFAADNYAVCAAVDYERLETSVTENWWLATVNFSTDRAPAFSMSIDPTQQRVKRQWQTIEHSLYVTKDVNGKMIANAAGEPIDGGVSVVMELPTLVFERNDQTFNGAYATAYSNAINSTPYSGAGAKTLRLKITSQEVFENGFDYWATRYEMAYFPGGWNPQPLNAGLSCLVPIGSPPSLKGPFPCMDQNKQPVTSPVPLFPDGTQIPIAQLPGAANYIEVNWFLQLPFQDLGLPELV